MLVLTVLCCVLLPQVWADVYTLPVPGCDGKTAAEIFEEAGCTTPAAPSCAACLGGPRDTFARMNEPEVSIFVFACVFMRMLGLFQHVGVPGRPLRHLCAHE